MQITLLSSHSKPEPVGHTTFGELFRKMQAPELVSRAKELAGLSISDNDRFKKEKAKLPAFVIGRFSHRNSESCEVMEPYFCFDIDKVPANEVKGYLDKLKDWEYTMVAYPSISAMGIRLMVKGEFNLGQRLPMYNFAASVLSVYLGIPAEEEKKREGIDGAYINTSTHDLPRLWYYCGITEYRARKDYVLFRSPKQTVIQSTPAINYGRSEADKVEAVVAEIERRGIDLTSDYDSWLRVGMSLVVFGEGGRDWFHRVSRMYSKYDHKDADAKYDNFVKSANGKVAIGTFFKFAKDAGVIVFQAHRQYDHLSPEGTKYEDASLEALVNSHIIRHKDKYDELIALFPLISAKCFRDPNQRTIFEAVERLSSSGRYIDPSTVRSVVGDEMVALVDKKPLCSMEAIVGYSQIIHSLYRKSEIQAALGKAAGDIMLDGTDVDDRLGRLDSEISSIASGVEVVDDSISSAVAMSQKNRIDLFTKATKGDDSVIGITTGIAAEDKFCGGRMPGTLVVVAARPGVGKTAKMLTEARMAAKSGKPIGIFSLEMTSAELAKRLTCQEGEIPNKKMKNPAVEINFATKEHEYIERIEDFVARLPILVDDRSRTMRAIKSKARTWRRLNKVEAIYVDYLGLIQFEGKSGNRAIDLGDITRDFKLLAKELGIPVILLCQLNRSTEIKSGSKRPSLHELRDSGRIEEDADIVEFIYRADYYNIKESENGTSLEGIVELIYAKHRDGKLDTVFCEFIGDCFLFKDRYGVPFTPHKHVENKEFIFGEPFNSDPFALSKTPTNGHSTDSHEPEPDDSKNLPTPAKVPTEPEPAINQMDGDIF